MSDDGFVPGSSVIHRAIDIFYDRLLADPRMAPWFDDVDLKRVRAHQRAFVLAALGGPDLYSGGDMHAAHANLALTDAEFDRAVEHLTASLREVGIEDALVVALGARLEPLRRQIAPELREA